MLHQLLVCSIGHCLLHFDDQEKFKHAKVTYLSSGISTPIKLCIFIFWTQKAFLECDDCDLYRTTGSHEKKINSWNWTLNLLIMHQLCWPPCHHIFFFFNRTREREERRRVETSCEMSLRLSQSSDLKQTQQKCNSQLFLLTGSVLLTLQPNWRLYEQPETCTLRIRW